MEVTMYRGRTLKVLNILAALSAMTMLAVCKIASASGTGANLVLSYPSGFASAGSAINIAGQAALSGTNIDLTTTAGNHEAGAAWFRTPQNIQSFTTDFTFQLDPSTYGMWFVVQNSNASTNPPGCCGSYYGITAVADANGEGFGDYTGQDAAIGKSVGLKFDLTNFNGNAGGLPANVSTTGIFVDGGPTNANFAPANDLLALGIDLHSNHVMSAHVVYDGTLLTMVLTDTVTLAQARLSWPINIPAIVGADTAYVGFTAGRIPAVTSALRSWDYYTGYNTRLSSPTFSVPAGPYAATQSVSLSASPGAAIYYTTNGKPPTTASTRYTGPISVSSSQVVQAIAVQSGYTDSLVAVGNYQIAAGGTPLINFPSGFAGAANLIALTGNAQFSGSTIQLTSTSGTYPAGYNEVAGVWYEAPVNISSFTSNFTMQITNPNANGMAFVIQNPAAATSRGANSGGPFALGNARTELGYGGTDVGGGIMSSIAVIFDLNNGGDLTGLYTNGATPTGSSTDMTSSGVSLHSGNPLNVTLAYNGTTLAMTITDTKTRASFSKSWAIDIPATVGGSTAYVGFTGSTGFANATQNVSSWTYSASQQTPAVPAAPTNLRVQ
jgi:Legume lectin domain/Chitobiase/beta-hexosaminidase C-terminal domain